jgi:hypothetical protein
MKLLSTLLIIAIITEFQIHAQTISVKSFKRDFTNLSAQDNPVLDNANGKGNCAIIYAVFFLDCC